ncbi:hypothetical protein D4764_18G0007680 [Takifugu flavidus]|uniref:Uncharacterized protein n=1 Tax=Takifugu flavidus TaxID=433684 RepID=A0A5C6NR01_9TELE|nr:hypothetical protein D4764_18G0007680 [Takifugu flavidus]
MTETEHMETLKPLNTRPLHTFTRDSIGTTCSALQEKVESLQRRLHASEKKLFSKELESEEKECCSRLCSEESLTQSGCAECPVISLCFDLDTHGEESADGNRRPAFVPWYVHQRHSFSIVPSNPHTDPCAHFTRPSRPSPSGRRKSGGKARRSPLQSQRRCTPLPSMQGELTADPAGVFWSRLWRVNLFTTPKQEGWLELPGRRDASALVSASVCSANRRFALVDSTASGLVITGW